MAWISLHADFVQRLQGFRRLQTLQHLAQITGATIHCPRLEIFQQGFEFQHQDALMAMQQAIELGAVESNVQRRRVDKVVVLDHVLHSLSVLCAQQPVQRLVQQRLRCMIEQAGDVGADLDDLQAGVRQRQQHTMGLDGAPECG